MQMMSDLVRRILRLEQRLDRVATIERLPRNSFAETKDPAGSDDADDGFGIGSFWRNSVTNDMYICCDPTAGAAVWQKITP